MLGNAPNTKQNCQTSLEGGYRMMMLVNFWNTWQICTATEIQKLWGGDSWIMHSSISFHQLFMLEYKCVWAFAWANSVVFLVSYRQEPCFSIYPQPSQDVSCEDCCISDHQLIYAARRKWNETSATSTQVASFCMYRSCNLKTLPQGSWHCTMDIWGQMSVVENLCSGLDEHVSLLTMRRSFPGLLKEWEG